MYRLGHKPTHRPIWPLRLAAGASLLIVIAFLSVSVAKFLNPKTALQQASPVITQVSANTAPVKQYNETSFTIDLPSDWKQTSHTTAPYNLYRWQSGGQTSNSRFIEVYQDSVPQNYTVNRVLAVESNGSQLTVSGAVSDNCADFTKSVANNPSTGTLAKWQGIDFLCDLNNYERNVVGTSTREAINSVTLKSVTNGSHQFFFTYTDHNINPDYSSFYNSLSSFRLK